MAGYILYSLDWHKFQQFVTQPTPDQLAEMGKLLKAGLEEHDGEFDEDDPISEWPAKSKALIPIAAQRLALPDWYGDLSTAGKTLWEGVIFQACLDNKKIDIGFRADSDGIYWDVIELAFKQLGVVPQTISDVALSAFGTRPYRYFPGKQPSQSRADFDREQDERRSSLAALGNMLGQFLEGAKRGEKDPAKLLEEITKQQGVSQEHKNIMKDLLEEGDSEDEDSDDEEYVFTPMHSMHTPDEVKKMLAEAEGVAPAIQAAKNDDVLRDYEEELLPTLKTLAEEDRMLFVQVDT